MPIKKGFAANPVLSQLAYEYQLEVGQLAAGSLFPTFRSNVQAGDFPTFSRENALNIPELVERAPGAGYQRGGLVLGSETFSTKDYGYELPMDDREMAIHATLGLAESDSVRRATDVILLNKELRAKNLATSAEVPSSTPTSKWDEAASDPIADIKTARRAIKANCGMNPTVLVMTEAVYDVLEANDALLDRYKYAIGGVLDTKKLATLFGVQQIVIADAHINVANDGQPLDVNSIWGDSVILAHVGNGQSLKAPSFGRTFSFNGYTKAGAGEIAISSYREESKSSTIHRAISDVQERLVAPAAGYHFSDVLS